MPAQSDAASTVPSETRVAATYMSSAMPSASGIGAAITKNEPIVRKRVESSPLNEMRCTAAGAIRRTIASAMAQSAARWIMRVPAASCSKLRVSVTVS